MTNKVKPIKGKKGGTGSLRKFAYKSFSQKISNLKIDPVRRVRRYVDDEENQKSYFLTAFENWVELNLSASFTAAVRELRPLSESLPLILHYKDKIFEILHTYIEKRDKHGMEPLLDLLAQFAHDLGAEFEPYLGRAVALLSSLVTSHIEYEPIEWTFNCMAFLLKYLSRLLAPDIRPLYDHLAQLLGREYQKPFVTRFAAEALSFLIRKAKGEALTLFVRHALEDLQKYERDAGYAEGLMIMFKEACISVERTIHSRGPQVFEALLRVTMDQPNKHVCMDVVQGVLTALVHHTSQETFQTVLGPTIEFIRVELLQHGADDGEKCSMAARLIYTAVGVRKGSRITDWVTIAGVATKTLESASECKAPSDSVWQSLKAVTMVIQYADLDVVISKCSCTAEKARDWQKGSLFVKFCEFVSRTGEERFKQFVLPYIQRFIVLQWTAHEEELFLLVPKLNELGLLGEDGNSLEFVTAGSQLTKRALENFRVLNESLKAKETIEQHIVKTSHTLVVLICLCTSSQTDIFYSTLASLLRQISEQPENTSFGPTVGRVLSLVSRRSKTSHTDELPVTMIHDLITKYATNIVFLSGAFDYIKYIGVSAFSEDQQNTISDCLISNLCSPSHDARHTSLLILELFSKTWTDGSTNTPDVLRTLRIIEEIPLAISNQRNIAMYVRKLGMEYTHIGKDSRYRKIVPYFCFGLMTVKFAPMWEDAAKALAMIVETNEELVANLAFKWLCGGGLVDDENIPSGPEAPPHMSLTPFQCSNLESLELASQSWPIDGKMLGAMLSEKYANDCFSHKISRSTARSQSLQVLCEIPRIAEKRSRIIVPLFLEWSTHSAQDDGAGDDEKEASSDTSLKTKWSRRDQTAMLTLFTKFTNAKSLFRAADVHASFLKLLTTGDVKIQGLALKCVLTWRTPAVKAYADRLTNLLDDTLFRDELTNFVQVDEEESEIQNEQRAGLMPVLLRLLYGRALSRKHASSGKKGMSSTRTAILASLVNFQLEERALFIEIALGELVGLGFVDGTNPQKFTFNIGVIDGVHFSLRKQLGLVRMVEDLMKQLGANMMPHMALLLDAVLCCLVSSVKTIKKGDVPTNEAERIASKSLRDIRISGFKCLNAMFLYCPNFDWKPYMPAIFDTLINPRLEKFPVEAAQGVSGLLTLFSTWANSKYTVLFFSEYNTRLIPTIVDTVVVDNAKDGVVLFIAKLLMSIVSMANSIDESVEQTVSIIKTHVIHPNVDHILDKLADVLSKNLTKDALEACIETVAVLAPFVSSTTETTRLAKISVFLLNQPSRRVNPKTKSDVLKIMINALPNCAMETGDDLSTAVFRTVSSLFGFFRDRPSRQILANVLDVFAARDPDLLEVAALCAKLNSFSRKRIDEPNYDLRLEAFAVINETLYPQLSAKQWLPIIHNMFFFIRDTETLSPLRDNASYSLKRFVEIATATPDTLAILTGTILPIIRNGASEASELTRREYVAVMAHIVRSCPQLDEVADLTPLLVGGDEEASFFANVLHIQQHRRQRALRRLAAAAEKEKAMQSTNIAKFLMPLVEHFVFDPAPTEDAHNLANEAIKTLGALAEQLQWGQWKAMFKRYLGYMGSKPEMVKIVIRLIGVVVDSLVKACGVEIGKDKDDDDDEEEEEEDEDEEEDEQNEKKDTEDGEKREDKVNGDVDVVMAEPEAPKRPRLSVTIPDPTKLAQEISTAYLPTLSDYLHKKDDSTVALRVPVAISLVKFFKIMPEDMMKTKLPGVLMDISHILRSRSQDDRDMTRRTLSSIALLLGPPYMSFILKELKSSLLRGYQLHVRSYTVHSMLVALVPEFPTGALDYVAEPIVDIIMDDIFGVTGSEKDAEGYINKMKEVKSSKSYDSMEILARITTLPYLGKLVRPIKALLLERLDGKMIKKIDELLRRLTAGLAKNATLNDRDILVFCYEIVQEVYKTQSAVPVPVEVDEKRARYLVNLKVPAREHSKVATSSHIFKLIKFALDILRTLLTAHTGLATPENLAGFIPILGDAVLSTHEEVQISALRLLTTIVRVPLPAIDDGARIFIDKAVSFIKSCTSTNAELAQASLKLIAGILKERRNVMVKDTTLGYILSRIKPDLEEPDRQGVTFTFLRAVLARRLALPELYDVMDAVATVMVTNQTRGVCDATRGLWLTFVLDYPQGATRWKKQLAFLAKNLAYPHEQGRRSVMDAVHAVVGRCGEKVLQEVVGTFFVPLAMALVNDDSAECRQMAGALVQKVFERADEERRELFVGMLTTWVGVDQNPLLIRLALQVYGLYFEVIGEDGEGELKKLLPRVGAILAAVPKISEDNPDEEGDQKEPEEWETIYFTLQLYTKIATLFPSHAFSTASAPTWSSIRAALRYPHAWIRLTSSTLLGTLFTHLTTFPESLSSLPLKSPHGVSLNADALLDIAYRTSGQLNAPALTKPVATHAVKNLILLVKIFVATDLAATNLPSPEEDEGEEEEAPATPSAVAWLLTRLTGVLRSERNIRLGLLSKRSAILFITFLVSHLPPAQLLPLAPTIIHPCFTISSLPPTSTMYELLPETTALLDLLQKNLGVTDYGRCYAHVKERVVEKRGERKLKRKMDAVMRPDVAARKKEKRSEVKMKQRKEKGRKRGEERRGGLL